MTENTNVEKTEGQASALRTGSARFSYSKWAWAYAAEIVESDIDNGYFEDDGLDREKCRKAFKSIIAQMKKRGG